MNTITHQFADGSTASTASPFSQTCPIFQVSDQQRCVRCRATWDAGDYDGECARFRKPGIAVREMPHTPGYFEAFVIWPIHPKRGGLVPVAARSRIGIYRSRNRAYERAMNWVEDWLKAKANRRRP